MRHALSCLAVGRGVPVETDGQGRNGGNERFPKSGSAAELLWRARALCTAPRATPCAVNILVSPPSQVGERTWRESRRHRAERRDSWTQPQWARSRAWLHAAVSFQRLVTYDLLNCSGARVIQFTGQRTDVVRRKH